MDIQSIHRTAKQIIMKKVICEHVGDYGNDEFDGPNPKQGDVLTVLWEGDYYGTYTYTFVEYGPDYGYSAWRFKEEKNETEKIN